MKVFMKYEKYLKVYKTSYRNDKTIHELQCEINC